MINDIKTPLLFFPDPIWTPDLISGALFLYFEKPLVIPIPSASSIGMLGIGATKITDLVKVRSPQWSRSFFHMYHLHHAGIQAALATQKLLEPLHASSFRYIHLLYPHTPDWMRESEELLQSTQIDPQELWTIVNPLTAADSLARHVLFEMYLTTIHSGDDVSAMGKDLAARLPHEPIPTELDADLTPLYEYCDRFFSSASLEDLLLRAYGLRLLALRQVQHFDAIFLSCPKLLDLLSQLPSESEENSKVSISDDVVAWEIFRQLVSPAVDPLDEKRVELTLKCRNQRKGEIQRLKNKCLSLAQKLSSIPAPAVLEQMVSQFIELEVRSELSDLLELDRKTFREFTLSLLSDEKTWIAFAALLAAIFTGNEVMKAGSAVAALSTVGARAVRSAADRQKTLRTSSYTLIYNLQKGTNSTKKK